MEPRRLILPLLGGLAYVGFLSAVIWVSIRFARNRMKKRVDQIGDALASSGAKKLSELAATGAYRGPEAEYDFSGSRVWVGTYFVSRDYIRLNLRVPTNAPLPHVMIHKERASAKPLVSTVKCRRGTRASII